jgi:putative endonuclease
MNYRKNLGRWGEKTAESFLIRKGYQIMGKNVRTPYGEIDLIGEQGGMIAFVEVKTRSSTDFGLPEESITPKKQAHMVNAAEAYMQDHPDLGMGWRLDVIGIRKMPGNQPPEIVHFENVLT